MNTCIIYYVTCYVFVTVLELFWILFLSNPVNYPPLCIRRKRNTVEGNSSSFVINISINGFRPFILCVQITLAIFKIISFKFKPEFFHTICICIVDCFSGNKIYLIYLGHTLENVMPFTMFVENFTTCYDPACTGRTGFLSSNFYRICSRCKNNTTNGTKFYCINRIINIPDNRLCNIIFTSISTCRG